MRKNVFIRLKCTHFEDRLICPSSWLYDRSLSEECFTTLRMMLSQSDWENDSLYIACFSPLVRVTNIILSTNQICQRYRPSFMTLWPYITVGAIDSRASNMNSISLITHNISSHRSNSHPLMAASAFSWAFEVPCMHHKCILQFWRRMKFIRGGAADSVAASQIQCLKFHPVSGLVKINCP